MVTDNPNIETRQDQPDRAEISVTRSGTQTKKQVRIIGHHRSPKPKRVTDIGHRVTDTGDRYFSAKPLIAFKTGDRW